MSSITKLHLERSRAKEEAVASFAAGLTPEKLFIWSSAVRTDLTIRATAADAAVLERWYGEIRFPVNRLKKFLKEASAHVSLKIKPEVLSMKSIKCEGSIFAVKVIYAQ